MTFHWKGLLVFAGFLGVLTLALARESASSLLQPGSSSKPFYGAAWLASVAGTALITDDDPAGTLAFAGMLVVCLLAATRPAQQITRVDPARALRAE